MATKAKSSLALEGMLICHINCKFSERHQSQPHSPSISFHSNTNGGLPGPLTANQEQTENWFSASTNVAFLSDPNFNGNIVYSKPVDGIPTTTGVEVFAHGLRNPFGICIHSNGFLYGTENGPNLGYVSATVLSCFWIHMKPITPFLKFVRFPLYCRAI